jgi:hypothetical protein
MATIKIKPKKSFSIQEFFFGCSLIDSEQSVTNWQDGNNVFDVIDGTWFCFSRKKNSNRVSKLVKIVNCGQVCTISYIQFRKRLACEITGILPYIKTSTAQCTITGIAPYIKTSTGTQCQITTIQPYIKTGTVVLEPVPFIGVTSINA